MMKIKTRVNNMGYEIISDPPELRGQLYHRYIMSDLIKKWSFIWNIPEGQVIVHHIDRNKTHNVRGNLMVMIKEKHDCFHNHYIDKDRRKRLSESHMGLKHTEETKQKLSEILTGKVVSEETKQKMSESRTRVGNPMFASSKIDEAGGIAFLIKEKRKGKSQTKICKELGYKNSTSIRNYLKVRGLKWSELK